MKMLCKYAIGIASLCLITLPVFANTSEQDALGPSSGVIDQCCESLENDSTDMLADHHDRREHFEKRQRHDKREFEHRMERLRHRMRREGRSKHEIHARIDREYREFERRQHREREEFNRREREMRHRGPHHGPHHDSHHHHH